MSLSLEDAIRRAKVRVEIDDNAVIIEREKLTQSQRSNEPTSQIGAYALLHSQGSDGDENLSYDGKFWRSKCSALLLERDQIEREMTQKMSDALEKYENLRKYVTLLEQRSPGSNEKVPANPSENANMEIILEKLRVYELLTATTIERGSDSEYICTSKNPSARKATRFTLQKVEHPDGDILVHPKGNVGLLPDYLQQGDIVCESSTVPVLMGDVLHTLYKEEEGV